MLMIFPLKVDHLASTRAYAFPIVTPILCSEIPEGEEFFQNSSELQQYYFPGLLMGYLWEGSYGVYYLVDLMMTCKTPCTIRNSRIFKKIIT